LSRSSSSLGKAIPENLADILTTFVIFVSLPALIFLRLPSLEISGDILVPIVMPWCMLAVSAALVFAVSTLLKWDQRIQGLLLLLVPLGNTSFLGIPMVQTFFGDKLVPYALLYDQFGTFLALATYGAAVTSLASVDSAQPSSRVKAIALKVISFPPFIALMLSTLLRSITFHPAVTSTLEILSSTLVPSVMIAVGFRIRLRIPQQHRVPLTVGLALKLVLSPLLALAGCRLLGLDGDAVDVSIFESGMPPMIAAWAVASKSGLDPDLGAAMVGLGILLSFATLPLLFLLL
jgi:predicted permease